MTDKPFYTLKAKDTFPLSSLCLTAFDMKMKDAKLKKYIKIEGTYLTGLKKLLKIFKKFEIDRDIVDSDLEDIEMDQFMTFALLYAVSDTFYSLKMQSIEVIDPKKFPERIPIKRDMTNIFFAYKNQASDLLIGLTKAWKYIDFGVKNVFDIFGIKIAELPLEVDNQKTIIEFTINDKNSIFFEWVFELFNIIIQLKDKYNFTEQFSNSQFFHINDYFKVEHKFKKVKLGQIVNITLHNIIVLYYLANLSGRYFLSDAGEMFEETIDKQNKEQKTKIDSKNIRSLLLKQSDEFMALIKDGLKNNKDFNREIKRIETWPIDID